MRTANEIREILIDAGCSETEVKAACKRSGVANLPPPVSLRARHEVRLFNLLEFEQIKVSLRARA